MEQRLLALEERVAALEAGRTLVDHLRERVGDGEISYAGSVGFDDREYAWAKDHTYAEVVAGDWNRAATTLESLGSPARLALLGELLRAPRNRGQLQEALGDSSTSNNNDHGGRLTPCLTGVESPRATTSSQTHASLHTYADRSSAGNRRGS
ncbi:hypothetical protein [Lentzea flava]|uniref:hypothetical protein n=1 Tax=Lentzea flava TaxID=103732 RepID=UPI001671368D|nr:hypothetical protein [Lentzea flava]